LEACVSSVEDLKREERIRSEKARKIDAKFSAESDEGWRVAYAELKRRDERMVKDYREE
jgi:hypothetical protein